MPAHGKGGGSGRRYSRSSRADCKNHFSRFLCPFGPLLLAEQARVGNDVEEEGDEEADAGEA